MFGRQLRGCVRVRKKVLRENELIHARYGPFFGEGAGCDAGGGAGAEAELCEGGGAGTSAGTAAPAPNDDDTGPPALPPGWRGRRRA